MYRCSLLVLVACSSSPKTSMVTSETPSTFSDLVTQVSSHLHRLDPEDAVSLGHHEFDGTLPDRSPDALANNVAQFERDKAALLAAKDLTPTQALERDVLLYKVRGALFDLVDREIYRRNPMAYSSSINLDAYIIRDYAPVASRA
ncbi:MAG TPA: hypothetical protein VK427_26990, partial [Kofleriaceae bacterium]|nr:hypothetical protein [Kofleriaceae bacterium]